MNRNASFVNTPEAQEHFVRLLALKKQRAQFADDFAYRVAFDSAAADIPDAVKYEVHANILLWETRACFVVFQWKDVRKDHRLLDGFSSQSRMTIRRNQRRRAGLIIFSQPMFQLARFLSTKEATAQIKEASYAMFNLVLWLMWARPLWEGAWGDPHTLKETYESKLKQGRAMREKLSELGVKTAGAEYGSSLIGRKYDIEEFVAQMFDMNLLGQRGRAKADPKGAVRGWLIRKLDTMLPADLTSNRYSTISGFLDLAGIAGLSPALVRSLLAATARRI